MSGLNIGDLAEQAGLKPLMGLSDARTLAELNPGPCLVCGDTPDTLFQRMIIHRYGMCMSCIKCLKEHADA